MATIRQIQYFSEVAEEGSLRKAAERMGVSQPTLSVQITALEKDLGLTLFERSRTSTRLTPSGRELLPVARDLLRQHHDCLLYTSPSPRDVEESRMPSSA